MFMYHHWLRLPILTRIKIASQFGFNKTGSTHVFDNVIQSDGYSVKDIETSLTKQAIKDYLSTDEDNMDFLWSAMVEKIEGRTPPEKEEIKIIERESVVAPVIEKKESPTLIPKAPRDRITKVKTNA